MCKKSTEETEQLIIDSYVEGETSLREVAEICKTDHHRVKRVLEKFGITIVKAKRKPFSSEHRKKLSDIAKGRPSWAKGKKMPKESLYKNMASHLRFDVGWEWLSRYEDIEKLKFLNRSITNRDNRWIISTEDYKVFIERFYYCEQFNKLYFKWLGTNDKYLKPSIDHVVPKAKGGSNTISNLQFLTWFENRCKNDLSQVEWDLIKSNLGDYLLSV
ncbi:hypothetical protein AXI76_gp103 [Pseudoalteromonas phage H101]|uniref:HNH nuclease domain-containing protein n=1 Tax=Pseudoalteromonas phage H101 TaxID=1654919 RepID=A0A0H4IN70_9CAUD|nr:hypothetical protein AXI76_gp103 [Pseudoalteromonas phage H101]AKO61004.1 hypothetical protein [Pseudoalteromonas phage H101]